MKETREDLDGDDLFLINEGFDLLSAFRSIKSIASRQAIITLIASIAEEESVARGETTAEMANDMRFDQ